MQNDPERLINDDEIAHLDKIFDKSRPLKTREDILKLAEFTDSETDDDDFPEPLSPEMMAEVEAAAREISRQHLIRKHGEEKADEIILNRELGELTYDLDDEDFG